MIELLLQKLEMVRIALVLTEESYTSQASFIDHDPLRKATTDIQEGLDEDEVEDFSPPTQSTMGGVEPALRRVKKAVEKKKSAAKVSSKTVETQVLPASSESTAVASKKNPLVARHDFLDKKNRHRFVRHMPWLSQKTQAAKPGQQKKVPMKGPRVLHADVNGAFNMIRKMSRVIVNEKVQGCPLPPPEKHGSKARQSELDDATRTKMSSMVRVREEDD